MWIFSNKYLDFFIFFGLGWISLFLVQFLSIENSFYMILSYLAIQLLDSGHVYTTLFRTYFKKNVWTQDKLRYIYLPLSIFIFSFGMTYLPFWVMIYFVTYLAIFHYYRQHIGFIKWYQKLNKRIDKVSENIFSILVFISILTFHVRKDVSEIIPMEFRFFLYPNSFLESLGHYLFFIIFAFWLLYELYAFLKNKRNEINRVLYIFFIALIYGYCFMFSNSLKEFYIPQAIIHGGAYVAIIILAEKKLNHSFNLKGTMFLVLLVAFLGHHSQDLLDNYTGDNAGNVSFLTHSIYVKLIVALTYTPVIYHYIIDGFIWRAKDKDAKIIYQK